MSVDFFYKGLSAEERIYSYKPQKSVVLAQGTLYEAWFDTLKTSPWYSDICESKKFPSDASKKTWEQFGDLRQLTFENWWLKTGHKIFSETIPYRPISKFNLDYTIKQDGKDNKAPTLILEIPLNLSPALLTQQFELLVAKQFDYLAEMAKETKVKSKKLKTNSSSDEDLFASKRVFNRWDHSTAKVHQQRDTKITYQSINRWLELFRDWEKLKKTKPKSTLLQFALLKNLSTDGRRLYESPNSLTKRGELMLSNAASEPLKMARFLMAHATEGVFPFTEPHPWVKGPSRKPRKTS
jgi:hypothetical protein